MMFEYTYLLKHFDADFFGEKNTQSGDFIIPIDEKITGRQPELFQTLVHTKNKFCFSISGHLKQYHKAFIKEDIIQNIVRLLFLPNYLKTDGRHVFFVDPGEEEDLDSIKDGFHNALKKQGIKIVLVKMVTASALPVSDADEKYISIVHTGLNNYLSSNEPEAGFEKFTETFTFPANFNKKWIVPVNDTGDFTNKIKLLDKFETWLRNKDPFKVQLIERYHAAGEEINRMNAENELLKFKLENSAYYLQLIRKESQGLIQEIGSLRLEITRLTQQIINAVPAATHLSSSLDDPDLIMRMQAQINAEHNRANETLNWYVKEYEVLPMWYKRFGQIIKVLMGKRTFKSLFKKQP